MPSLAHEGNPKEDEITIGPGDVLSTAILTINLQSYGGVAPISPPEAPVNPSSSSCPNVLTWPDDRNPIPFFYNDGQSGGSLTIFTDAQPDDAPFTSENHKWLVLTLESSPECCGCTITPVHMVDIPTIEVKNYGSSETPDLHNQAIYPCHDITMGGNFLAVDRVPYAGICCFVEDGSTVHNFTGYVMACNYQEGVTKLMKYSHGDLCEEGQILGVVNAVPTVTNDLVYLQVFTDPNASSDSDTIWNITAGVQNAAGTDYATPVDLQTHDGLMDVSYTATATAPDNSTVAPGDRHNRANVGFVAIGSQNQEGGIMVFGATITKFGVRSRTDCFCFADGELS